MRLKTITGHDMQDAMRQVREGFGDDAVIVSTSRAAGGKGVSVTVAMDQEIDEFGPAVVISEQPAENRAASPNYGGIKRTSLPDYILRDIEQILLYHGVVPEVIDQVLRAVAAQPQPKDDSDNSLRQLLANALSIVFRFIPVDYLKEGYRYIMIGSPGVGKTLTTAKLAARLVQDGGTLRLVSTDTKRAGAIDQLAAYADVLGIELEVATNRAELKAILADLRPKDRLIVDSAGANPYDFKELKELAEFAGLNELEPLLVFPAGGDPMEALEIASSFAHVGVERILFTRLDIAKRYGGLLSAAASSNLAMTHCSSGERVLDDFTALSPMVLAGLLMDYRAKRAT